MSWERQFDKYLNQHLEKFNRNLFVLRGRLLILRANTIKEDESRVVESRGEKTKWEKREAEERRCPLLLPLTDRSEITEAKWKLSPEWKAEIHLSLNEILNCCALWGDRNTCKQERKLWESSLDWLYYCNHIICPVSYRCRHQSSRS